ncbi:(deoxy)nucleoside triphosphate pyrophosphohydrolase [Lysinibacillus irui]|uniref:8-oxo-dGTP diphosphatase n=1 Tax=Lysinibacillus irui TaxID=2998077 RepID=A0ABU5NM70_9BACI|nr:(deoxy)nucleoside triphosphate pyrophosphohydrolase [Lysinibacillus irui]MEA0555557.1 (deoxy)nucleoside triphosphate pyrophosphohydrolase [Lysinibacillus irui]MEA0977142.1 (deoxy)nucleoside triphosphate pyrophosphohydrolase [Lysinibacillus irui]MEA1043296.1 (deoxy)nucleoside triphosphate pyrophosphohydrolase [Lysinibacillus irui]
MKQTIHVVGAIIENEQQEIFCALRNPTMVLANYWEFPGGKIEQGETPKQALYREILEEFNCMIRVGEQVAETFHEYDQFFVHLQTYKASIIQGVPEILEHAEARWVARNQLLDLPFAPADLPSIEKLLAEK